MRQIKAVFFDFGGTLMDLESDRKAHLELMKSLQRKYRLRRDPKKLLEEYEIFCEGRISKQGEAWIPAKDMYKLALERILPSLGSRASEINWKWFYKEYFRVHKEHMKLHSDALTVLSNIKKMGLHCGLISDVDSDFLSFSMDLFALGNFFDSITTSEEVGVAKPNPKIFQVALQKAKCKGEEAVYIGDSFERDVLGAKKVGMTPIMLCREDTSSQRVDYLAKDLKEASRIIADFLGRIQ